MGPETGRPEMARVSSAFERARLLADHLSDRDFCSLRCCSKASRDLLDPALGYRLYLRGYDPVFYLLTQSNFLLAELQVTLGWPVGSRTLYLLVNSGRGDFFEKFAAQILPDEIYCLEAIRRHANPVLEKLLELDYPISILSERLAASSRNQAAQRLLRRFRNSQNVEENWRGRKRSQTCL